MIRVALFLPLALLACLVDARAQQGGATPSPAAPSVPVAVPVEDSPTAEVPAAAAPTQGAPAPAPAVEEVRAAENPNHEQLRALRDGITAAMNKRDIEGVVSFLHEKVVFTTMNGDVAVGKKAIQDYYFKMMQGPNRAVDAISVKFNADALTELYHSDTMGICYGSTQDVYTLKGGKRMDINARWTATMVKENGKWLVSAIHYSTNMFDNPVLTAFQKTMMMIGMGCAVVGLLLGMMIGRKTSSRR